MAENATGPSSSNSNNSSNNNNNQKVEASRNEELPTPTSPAPAPQVWDVDRPNKKRKFKRRKKDPLAPRHPLSAYVYYVTEQRPLIAKAYPQYTFQELSRVVARRWKALPKTQKIKYHKKAEEDKERYEREKAEFVRSRGQAGLWVPQSSSQPTVQSSQLQQLQLQQLQQLQQIQQLQHLQQIQQLQHLQQQQLQQLQRPQSQALSPASSSQVASATYSTGRGAVPDQDNDISRLIMLQHVRQQQQKQLLQQQQQHQQLQQRSHPSQPPLAHNLPGQSPAPHASALPLSAPSLQSTQSMVASQSSNTNNTQFSSMLQQLAMNHPHLLGALQQQQQQQPRQQQQQQPGSFQTSNANPTTLSSSPGSAPIASGMDQPNQLPAPPAPLSSNNNNNNNNNRSNLMSLLSALLRQQNQPQ